MRLLILAGVLALTVVACASAEHDHPHGEGSAHLPGPGAPSGSPSPRGSLPTDSTIPDASVGSGEVEWVDRIRDWPADYTRPDSVGYPFRGVEHIRYVVACLRDLGFEVLETTNRTDYLVNRGNLSIAEITEVQSGCEQRAVGIGLVDPRPESPEEEYALLVEVHQCLIEAGFPVPELVTLDAYVDGDHFDPYEAVGGITSVPVGVSVPGNVADSDSVRAAEACPYGG